MIKSIYIIPILLLLLLPGASLGASAESDSYKLDFVLGSFPCGIAENWSHILQAGYFDKIILSIEIDPDSSSLDIVPAGSRYIIGDGKGEGAMVKKVIVKNTGNTAFSLRLETVEPTGDWQAAATAAGIAKDVYSISAIITKKGLTLAQESYFNTHGDDDIILNNTQRGADEFVFAAPQDVSSENGVNIGGGEERAIWFLLVSPAKDNTGTHPVHKEHDIWVTIGTNPQDQ